MVAQIDVARVHFVHLEGVQVRRQRGAVHIRAQRPAVLFARAEEAAVQQHLALEHAFFAVQQLTVQIHHHHFGVDFVPQNNHRAGVANPRKLNFAGHRLVVRRAAVFVDDEQLRARPRNQVLVRHAERRARPDRIRPEHRARCADAVDGFAVVVHRAVAENGHILMRKAGERIYADGAAAREVAHEVDGEDNQHDDQHDDGAVAEHPQALFALLVGVRNGGGWISALHELSPSADAAAKFAEEKPILL